MPVTLQKWTPLYVFFRDLAQVLRDMFVVYNLQKEQLSAIASV